MPSSSLDDVLALSLKAKKLSFQGHHARAAVYYARATAAARQLPGGGKDCLVVAFLEHFHCGAFISHSRTPGLALADSVAAKHLAYRELGPEIVGVVERRRAAGTLLRVTAMEKQWYQTYEEKVSQEVFNEDSPLAAWTGAALGYDVYLFSATSALLSLVLTSQRTGGQPDAVPVSEVANTFAYVAGALDLFTDTVSPEGRNAGALSVFLPRGQTPLTPLKSEAFLLQLFEQDFIASGLCTGFGPFAEPMTAAWERLQSSMAFHVRCCAASAENTRALLKQEQQRMGRNREENARRVQRCALPLCGKPEAHPSQFQSCSGCRGAVYCCREHQVADWPAHKAPCKAARAAKQQQQQEDGTTGTVSGGGGGGGNKKKAPKGKKAAGAGAASSSSS